MWSSTLINEFVYFPILNVLSRFSSYQVPSCSHNGREPEAVALDVLLQTFLLLKQVDVTFSLAIPDYGRCRLLRRNHEAHMDLVDTCLAF